MSSHLPRAPRPQFLLLHCLFPSRPCSLHHFLPPPPLSLSPLACRARLLPPAAAVIHVYRARASGRERRRRWLKPLVLAAADEVSDGSSLEGRREGGREMEKEKAPRKGRKQEWEATPPRRLGLGLLCRCRCNDEATRQKYGYFKIKIMHAYLGSEMHRDAQQCISFYMAHFRGQSHPRDTVIFHQT